MLSKTNKNSEKSDPVFTFPQLKNISGLGRQQILNGSAFNLLHWVVLADIENEYSDTHRAIVGKGYNSLSRTF